MLASRDIVDIAKLELDAAGAGPYQVGMAKDKKSPVKNVEQAKVVTNRIREIRESKVPRMTIAALASLVNTTQAQMSRLETGERELTEDWMRRIAKALDVEPADLLETATFVNLQDEVEPYIGPVGAGVLAAIKSRDLLAFKITSRSLDNLELKPGDEIVFDFSEAAKTAAKTGDVVLATITRKSDRKSAKIIRQFIAPGLLATNRNGTRNLIISIDEPNFLVEILAVRLSATA